MFLLDGNVWLALTFDSHLHSPAGKKWFEGLSGQICYFCRMTQLGYLRLATDRSIFGKHALTLGRAWQKYDLFLSDARISYADEPADLETHWRALTQTKSRSPKVWNDAYLAAFAHAASLEIVTFDKGFAQYKNVSSVILT
jgi:toxin-antitoxin system PIN domain toxin